MNYTLEICANSVQSALNAQAAGAARVELCDNPRGFGTTPNLSARLITLSHEKNANKN